VNAAVLFDRDGIVNELVPDPDSGLPESPLHPEDVTLVPSAPAALRALRDAGFLLVGISNQPAAAKGTVSRDELDRVQSRVLDLLAEEGIVPDGFFICFHHPLGVVQELTGECECRKPAPGLLLEAAVALDLDLETSWMLGDTDADVEAGRAAGSRTILVEYPGSAHKRRSTVDPDIRASDVEIASRRILVHRSR